jgi:hypothetical protein
MSAGENVIAVSDLLGNVIVEPPHAGNLSEVLEELNRQLDRIQVKVATAQRRMNDASMELANAQTEFGVARFLFNRLVVLREASAKARRTVDED